MALDDIKNMDLVQGVDPKLAQPVVQPPAPVVEAPMEDPSIIARQKIEAAKPWDGVVRSGLRQGEVAPDYVKKGADLLEAQRLAAEPPDIGKSAFNLVNVFDKDNPIRLGFNNNNVVQFMDMVSRIDQAPGDDPTWIGTQNQKKREKWAQEQGVPSNLMAQLNLTRSPQEAAAWHFDYWKKQRAYEVMEKQLGPVNWVAHQLGTVFDADTLISFALPGGALAKAGRLGRSLSAGRNALLSGTAGQAIGEAASPDPQWANIPITGLSMLGLGTLFGGLSPAPRERVGPGRAEPPKAGERVVDNSPEEFPQEVHDPEIVVDQANKAMQDMKTDFEKSLDTDLKNQPLHDDGGGHDDPFGSILADTVAAQRAAEEEAAAKAAKTAGGEAKPKVEEPPNLEEEMPDLTRDSLDGGMPNVGGKGNLGAAAQVNNPASIVLDSKVQDAVYQGNKARMASGIGQLLSEGILNSPLGRKNRQVAVWAQKVLDGIQRIPGLRTDWDKFVTSPSPTAKWFMFNMGADPSQLVVNMRGAYINQRNYIKQLAGVFAPFNDKFHSWADDNAITWWQRTFDDKYRNKFHNAVIAELMARYHDGPGYRPTSDPHILEAANIHDRFMELDAQFQRGNGSTTAVAGAENLQPKSGYVSQKWLGRKMLDMVNEWNMNDPLKGGEKAVRRMIEAAYTQIHGTSMTAADIKKYARATYRRVTTQGEGQSTNLLGLLQTNGAEFMKKMLMDDGITEAMATQMVKRLESNAAEVSKMGHLHHRIDVDMRFVSTDGLKLQDVLDNDLGRMAHQRMRSTGGRAAMASKGIRSNIDVARIWEQIKAEQEAHAQSLEIQKLQGNAPQMGIGERATTFEKHLTKQDFDDFMSNFGAAGERTGRLDTEAMSRLRKVANLTLLGAMGFAQAGETAGVIAAAGWGRFWQHAGPEFRDALAKRDSELIKEAKHFGIFVHEDALYNPTMWDSIGMEAHAARDVGGIISKLDKGLNLAQRYQSILSGFHGIKDIQSRIAVTTMTNKIMQNLAGLANDMTPERWENLGFASGTTGLDPRTLTNIRQYIANGTIEFQNGQVRKLNLDKWNPSTLNDFRSVINRAQDTMVQQALAGEQNSMLHRNGVAAMFAQLKSYPLLAMRKQFTNNVAQADPQAMMMFMYSLAASGTMYMASQTAAGKTENLTPEKVMRGAFSMSNVTGWIPMMTDPVAYMFGQDWADLDGFSPRGGPINQPAAYSAVQGLLSIPRAAAHATGAAVGLSKWTADDTRALHFIPLIGRLLGINWAINQTRPDPKAPRDHAEVQKRRLAELQVGAQKPKGPPQIGIENLLGLIPQPK